MAFNLFPQTDFRQMDLNYVLEVSKQAAANLEEYAADKEQVVATQAAAERALAAAQEDIETARQAAASASEDAQTASGAAGTATQAAASAEQDAQTASAAAERAEQVQESIPADYTDLSNQVSELKSDLSIIDERYIVTVPNTAYANVTVMQGVEAGVTYQLTNNTGYTLGAYTKAQDNTNTEVITESLDAGRSKTFTATQNAYKLTVYAKSDGNGTVTCVNATKKIPEIEASIVRLESKLNTTNASLEGIYNANSVNAARANAGYVYGEMQIISGREYTVTNGSDKTITVELANSAGAQIAVISDSLAPTRLVTFTAENNAAKFRFYIAANATGNIAFEQIDTLVGTLNQNVSALQEDVIFTDAKVSNVSDLIKTDPLIIDGWENGSFYVNGTKYDDTKAIRSTDFVNDYPGAYISTGYKMQIFGWDGSTCLGIWSGTVFGDTNVFVNEVNFDTISKTIGNYSFKIVIRREDDGAISTSESAAALKYYNYVPRLGEHRRKPRLTFIDDDCYAQSLTIWEDIAKTAHIPATLACITNQVGDTGMATWGNIERLSNIGLEFISHTHNHINLNTNDMTEEAVEADFAATVQALREHYGASDFIVYPYTLITTRNKALVRKWFKLGLGLGNTYNKRYVNCDNVNRVDINGATKESKVIDGQTVNVYPFKSLDTIKTLIDRTVLNNGWIVFMSHLRNTYGDGYYYDNDVKQLILDICDYARSKGVTISTVKDAYADFYDVIQ